VTSPATGSPRTSRRRALEVVGLPPHLELLVPVHTRSEANRSRHEAWFTTKKHVDSQHLLVSSALRSRTLRCPYTPPLLVTLTRISFGHIDSDNVWGALKHVRDAVAKWLGIDDRRDDLVEYQCKRERGPRGYHGVRIRIEPRS
jgi:hypothetical protein